MGDTLESVSGGELLLRVSAAGGSITLYGKSTANGWQFSRSVNDLAATLINEPHIAHASDTVTNWNDALALLDHYRWHRLCPSFVHCEFRDAIWEAVELRFKSEAQRDIDRVDEWREVCAFQLAIASLDNESKAFKLVGLEQGTNDWLEWRSQGIGASDAPTIMGENPWKSASQLSDEKCGLKKTASNNAMSRGSALEPEARRRFEQRLGVQVMPACLQSLKIDWLRASLDGIASDLSRVVEIKCGQSVYRKTSTSGQVPSYYYGQLQHILAVTNFEKIDFWCYWPNQPELHLIVPRDDTYIERMLDVEESFWLRVERRRAEQLQ